MINIQIILDIFNLLVSCMAIILAISFLFAAIVVYYQGCFDFFTLLACNTCLSTVMYVSTGLSTSIYMLIWDQAEIKVKTDLFCTIRGYLSYIGIATIYHSYVLQTLYIVIGILNVSLDLTQFITVSCSLLVNGLLI
jgi:hypothetical protein